MWATTESEMNFAGEAFFCLLSPVISFLSTSAPPRLDNRARSRRSDSLSKPPKARVIRRWTSGTRIREGLIAAGEALGMLRNSDEDFQPKLSRYQLYPSRGLPRLNFAHYSRQVNRGSSMSRDYALTTRKHQTSFSLSLSLTLSLRNFYVY
jgi:hypothetical protein